MEVKLMNYTTNPLQNIEEAASTCYNSEPSKTGSITKLCYLSHHESVLEHTSFTFKIYGVSRALMAQLTRHRMASFSVESQRYVDMTGNSAVIPDTISNTPGAMGIYLSALNAARLAYTKLQELGVPNEDARFVLPNACTTVITMTMNLRELIHFCNERLCTKSQWQIRRLAQEIVKVVNEATDNAFDFMLVPKCERNRSYPFCTESKDKTCGKHPRLCEVYRVKGEDDYD